MAIKLINDNCFKHIQNYRADIVIADIPWDKNITEEEYRNTFKLLKNSCIKKVIVLVDNWIPAVYMYLKLSNEIMQWRSHFIWLHDNNFTHIFEFTPEYEDVNKYGYSVLNLDNIRVTNFCEERPVELMKLLCQEYNSVLDPFMGSGASAVACKELGIDYVGIELIKNQFDMAKARL